MQNPPRSRTQLRKALASGRGEGWAAPKVRAPALFIARSQRLGGLTPGRRGDSVPNTEFRIPNREPGMIPLDPAPNLIDQVYARILEAITDRTLLPGQRIRQNELADKLGVSRQPVSHALHLLHRQGLITESGRRGFEVTQLDPGRIRQLYEVRGTIDALAARMAAKRAKTDLA